MKSIEEAAAAVALAEKELIEKSVLVLQQKYKEPPKKFEVEERRVKQSAEQLAQAFNAPQGQKSLVPTIDIDSIVNMTKRGQITLVAEKMNDQFLKSMEQLVKTSTVEFSLPGQTTTLPYLYNFCKNQLTRRLGAEGKPPPSFQDILLNMYTAEDPFPFYKKLNAIVGGYDASLGYKTTDEERKLAFLLNIGIHKAGLDKRKLEQQETPDLLFRGQGFGLQAIQEKFEEVKRLQLNGELSALTPEQLASITPIMGFSV